VAIIDHILIINTAVLLYDQNRLFPSLAQWKNCLFDPVSSRPKKVEAPVRCGEQTWNARDESLFTFRNAAGRTPPSIATG
jgi:hypothetical protein